QLHVLYRHVHAAHLEPGHGRDRLAHGALSSHGHLRYDLAVGDRQREVNPHLVAVALHGDAAAAAAAEELAHAGGRLDGPYAVDVLQGQLDYAVKHVGRDG